MVSRLVVSELRGMKLMLLIEGTWRCSYILSSAARESPIRSSVGP